jgi:dethiobiotin synthetase
MPASWSVLVPDFLVTGTDTGVGKTVIASALVKALCAQGVRAIGFKPVQTGHEDGQPTDADLLASASSEQTSLALPLLQLTEPLAPAVAADRAGVRLSAGDIEARVELLQRGGYTLVIEGAGGVMVPLVWGYTVLDLASRFSLEAVIVARPGLGTLNHTMMTAAVLRARNVPIRAVVLNGRKHPPDLAEATNPQALARMLPGVMIVEVPHRSAATIQETILSIMPSMTPLLEAPRA